MWNTIDVPIVHEYIFCACMGNDVATSPHIGTTGIPPVTPLGPTVSTAPTSLTSSVTHPVLSARQTHRQPRSSQEAKQSDEASSVHREGPRQESLPFIWKSWKAVPPEVKEAVLHKLSHHNELMNLDANENQYMNDLCAGRFN
ncbi:hypothetical protein ACFX2A_014656 [Malus domestica]